MLAVAIWQLDHDAAGTAAINVDATGVALRGYDPVAYFASGGERINQTNRILAARHHPSTSNLPSA